MGTEELVRKYSTLKERVADLQGKRKLWEGRKEVHEANKVTLLADLRSVGVETSDLEKAKVELEGKLTKGLADLEKLVVEAEGNFVKLRSDHE